MDKETLESRIADHIKDIVKKARLTHDDYLTLCNEVARIEVREREIKREVERIESNQKYAQMLAGVFSGGGTGG